MTANEPVLGGFCICRPQPTTVRSGDEVGLTLMSDLHIGAAHVDYKLIQREIARAAEEGDRVLINGDLLDLILPKDHKRYDPTAIHPRLANRTDIINAAVTWAVELFAPVCSQIDMIGVGNHETAVTKWHSVDPTLLVVYELEKLAKEKIPEHVVHYGGYTGFVDYRFRDGYERKKGVTGGGGTRWVLYYHHGFGGAAPVTKGMIDFNRKDTFIDADLLWMGHKHNRWTGTVEKLSCPQQGEQPNTKEVRHVMTGAYFNTYVGQSQESVRKHGRRSNYAADAGMAPQGRGGARVTLKFGRGLSYQVNVTQ